MKDPAKHKFLNAGCGTWYADGWVNADVWESDTTKPDVRVTPGEPYPFDANVFDAIYLGHVLEHMDWHSVPNFLLDMSRIAKPGAPILITGPDVFRCIKMWREGKEPWWMVESVMEHQGMNWQPDREEEVWDGAEHKWNCHHQRVWNLLETVGFGGLTDLYDRIPNDPSQMSWHDTDTDIEWPVVGKHHWQMAIRFTALG